jgi:excisionase family DNA binding protein
MATIHPGVTGRRCGEQEPLAVTPRQACQLLAIGNTRLYQLIGTGELAAYKDGRARRITMQSIRDRVARLAAATAANGTTQAPMPSRRGRPRKLPAGESTP